MIKYAHILLFLVVGYAIDCPESFVLTQNSQDCIPENFYFETSMQQAAYFFLSVTIEGSQVNSEDWVGAFNGDVCVGARKWNTDL